MPNLLVWLRRKYGFIAGLVRVELSSTKPNYRECIIRPTQSQVWLCCLVWQLSLIKVSSTQMRVNWIFSKVNPLCHSWFTLRLCSTKVRAFAEVMASLPKGDFRAYLLCLLHSPKSYHANSQQHLQLLFAPMCSNKATKSDAHKEINNAEKEITDKFQIGASMINGNNLKKVKINASAMNYKFSFYHIVINIFCFSNK